MNKKVSTFSQRLKEIIDYKGIKQAELARQLKVDRSTITKYINGENTTTTSRLDDIANYFNINPAWLLGYDVPMEKNPFKNRLKEAMQLNNITQADLSKKSGIAEASISNYLSGGYEAGNNNIKRLADALFVNPLWLMGENIDMNYKKEVEDTIKVPLFANISQNKGDSAIRYIDLPKERLNGQNADYFLYKVSGDNMAPKYLDGDIVLFKYNNMPKNNKDVLININDKETVFSKINIEEKSIKLNKYNPFYDDITYTKDEMKKLNIKIIAEVQSLEYRDLRNN